MTQNEIQRRLAALIEMLDGDNESPMADAYVHVGVNRVEVVAWPSGYSDRRNDFYRVKADTIEAALDLADQMARDMPTPAEREERAMREHLAAIREKAPHLLEAAE